MITEKKKIESRKYILAFTVYCYIFMCKCQLHQILKMFNWFFLLNNKLKFNPKGIIVFGNIQYLCANVNFSLCLSVLRLVLCVSISKLLFCSQGGVVLVSHDERLIRMICKELWVVKDGTVKSLDGGFDEYRNIVEKELAENGIWWLP